ncbi:GNAT family N-acetyltransferase [Oryzihumus leptocrescens]|uniref:L-amino acid N-acyltransferase YncA n=1 Tax=Oryzihumus leptocrescens TaxID=297536 RepID=A0A542ZJR0_9MICO|nr:GNAT family N-acetyltransferase [Oryzihumus leptocrescens]TQL60596.1 L-amino acid N-acyltransferase YncA [Oryzihumus leptocrescens]
MPQPEQQQVLVRDATSADGEAVADVFLAARHTAMPWLWSPRTEEEVRWWFGGLPERTDGRVLVAERDGAVVGFAEVLPGELNHLYVDPQAQGGGVGTALFSRATELEPEGFELWTFQRNARARAFYEARGCREVYETDGADNEEREPDVRIAWAPA